MKTLFSYTSLKQLVCPRRFYMYMEYKIGEIPKPEMRYGNLEHVDFENRLIANNPANDFQRKIFQEIYKKYAFIEIEKYVENKDLCIHGIIDVYLHNLDENYVDVLELKTGAWHIEQLYLYKALTGAKSIYLLNLTKETFDRIEIDEKEALSWVQENVEKAKKILEIEDLNDVPVRPGTHCSTCPFAKNCRVNTEIDIITKDNLPEALNVYFSLKSRLKMFEEMLKTLLEENGGEVKVGKYRVYYKEQPFYRLSKLLKKEDLVRRLIEDNRLDLLTFKSGDVAKLYPHFFKEFSRKQLQIEELEGGEER